MALLHSPEIFIDRIVQETVERCQQLKDRRRLLQPIRLCEEGLWLLRHDAEIFMSQDIAISGISGVSRRHSFEALPIQSGKIPLERRILQNSGKLLDMVINVTTQLFQQRGSGTPNPT